MRPSVPDEKPKHSVWMRVWFATVKLTDDAYDIACVWRWRVTVSTVEHGVGGNLMTADGASTSERLAKWYASRAMRKLRKQMGIGRREPIDVYFEKPDVQVTDKEMQRAAKRLQAIEKDLNG